MFVSALIDPNALRKDGSNADTTIDIGSENIDTLGVITAEQLTSTDDITMEGHLLTLGDVSAATDTVISFLGSTNTATLTYDESADDLLFSGDIQVGDRLNLRTKSTYLRADSNGDISLANTNSGRDIFVSCNPVGGGQEFAVRVDSSLRKFKYNDNWIMSLGTGGDFEFVHSGASGTMTHHTGDLLFDIKHGLNVKVVDEASFGDGGTTNYAAFSATGDLVFVGTGGLPFGCLKGIDETITCTDQNTYYQVTFDTAGPVNLVEADTTNNELQVDKAGIYNVSVTACFHSGVSHDFELLVRKNDGGTDLEPHLFQTTAVANQVENTAGNCFIDLSADDRIELWVRCTDAAGQDAIFDHVALTCVQVGGT